MSVEQSTIATTPRPVFETGMFATAAFVEVDFDVDVPEEVLVGVDMVVETGSVAVALGLLLLQKTPL